MFSFQTLALLKRVMMASMRRRTNSDFERTAELTKVEREPTGSVRETRSESHRESTTSCSFDDQELLEEVTSDTEDVFETN